MARFARSLAGVALSPLIAAPLVAPSAHAQVQPHRSATSLVSSNGRAVIGYEVPERRITSFLEHPYRARSDGSQTRDLAYDLYAGLRVGPAGTQGVWLTDIEPSVVAYEPGTGIIRSSRTIGELVVDEYHFVPIELGEHASFHLVRVERKSGAATPIDGFFLYNFHLGQGAPEPDALGETVEWDAGRDAWLEWGPSGLTLGYASIGPSAHHAASPDNPFPALTSGANLSDNAGTGGTYDDAAAGLQWSLGSLAAGQSAWFGSFVVLDATSNVAPRIDAVRAFIGSKTADQVLEAERAAWQAWHTPAPAGLSAIEARVWQQQMAVLRMGQVSEPGKSDGQILASLPPGMWNISWVRDMAYAVIALIRTGHFAEAKRALEFQLAADSGKYADIVGHPYQISITRYFGDGVEETDENEHGPNIEYDGFGLFLWTLHEYVEASGDTEFLDQWWPTVSEKIADVLVKLQEPSGLIAADSSIWEVHWNGQQKHFAYTTLTAANGLCRVASLAEGRGQADLAATYRDAGRRAQQALVSELSAPDGTIAQSLEELGAGHGFLDAAAIEAVGFGLVDPAGRAASATLSAMQQKLVPASGRGFMRNDDGGWYDSQEWVFVDLRTVVAMRAMQHGDGPELLGWITAQAAENFDLISELHDAQSADYRGEMPMVGFGAGAWSIAVLDRENPKPVSPCGQFADETAPDGGAGGSDGGAGSAGASGDANDDDGGCGCRLEAATKAPAVWTMALFAAALLVRRFRGRRR